MPKDQKAPHAYPHGKSQLETSETFAREPVERALQQAAAAGREKTRLLVKINLYEPPQVRGGSGRYVAWPTLRWKHDVTSVTEAQHFAKALDRFVMLYQQDPSATDQLLQAQDFHE
jgi:hypothetical protein